MFEQTESSFFFIFFFQAKSATVAIDVVLHQSSSLQKKSKGDCKLSNWSSLQVVSTLPEGQVYGLQEDSRIIGLIYTTKMNKMKR